MTPPPLLWKGLLVPWAILWSGEEDEEYAAICDFAGLKAIHDKSARGAGHPLFAKFHYQRARACALLGLCEICGGRIDGPAISMAQASDEHPGRIVVTEPLACPPCAELAQRQCPALPQQKADKFFVMREVVSYRLLPTTIEHEGEALLEQYQFELTEWRSAA